MSKRSVKDVKQNSRAVVKPERYVFQLFVAGILPNSLRAISNIRIICDKYLKGRYDLEIIDIYQQPTLALAEDVIAIPLLVRLLPRPEERLIGDLSDIDLVLKTLGLL